MKMSSDEFAIRNTNLMNDDKSLVFVVTAARRLRLLNKLEAPLEVIEQERLILAERINQLLEDLIPAGQGIVQ